jgi:NAD(P)-dependent dehydrogenase (short-subunit alcohol dehydrogenase family)
VSARCARAATSLVNASIEQAFAKAARRAPQLYRRDDAKRADEKDTSFDDAIKSLLDEEWPFMEMKRRGHADEVASVITFPCSERASVVNGSNYRVDSGSVATI